MHVLDFGGGCFSWNRSKVLRFIGFSLYLLELISFSAFG